MKMKLTENAPESVRVTLPRDLAHISNMQPLCAGDCLELDGPTGAELWEVRRGGYGWQLIQRTHSGVITHPTIKDLDSMADFIGAILTLAKSY
jgi:hypothetical protein